MDVVPVFYLFLNWWGLYFCAFLQRQDNGASESVLKDFSFFTKQRVNSVIVQSSHFVTEELLCLLREAC